jgi:hypothetical protein
MGKSFPLFKHPLKMGEKGEGEQTHRIAVDVEI